MPASRTLRDGELLAIFKYSALTADAILTDITGKQAIDLGNIDIDSLVIEHVVTTLAGSSTPTIRAVAKTSNSNVFTTTSADCLQGDASTTFATANQTAAGAVLRGIAKQASTGASANNLGKYLGIMLDVVSGTVTDATGEVRVYVKGK